MPANPRREPDPTAARLRALRRVSPDLEEAARVYGSLLPLLRDAVTREAPAPLDAGQARTKMAAGRPLLRDLALELDLDALQELMCQLARALEGPRPPARKAAPGWSPAGRGGSARRVRVALELGRLDVGALLKHVAAGDRDAVAASAGGLDLDAELLWVLAENALKPSLRAWRAQLSPMVEGVPWHRGSCFVCGARAALGELQGNARARHLRCGLCGSDWPVRRMQCPFCGNEGHATQRLLYAEGCRETQRVEACDVCRRYVKVIAAHDPTPPELVAVEDLATLHLDRIAERNGYSR